MTVRRIAALLASTCALALLAGCGTTVNTAKETFKRTTVPATAVTSGTGGPSPTGGPTGSEDPGHPVDPIYARDKLRLVYPCGLVDTKAIMGSSGEPEQPELQDYNKCFFTVKGDSSVPRAYVTLDEHTYVGDDDPKTTVAGLTATTDDTISQGTCFVEGIIQRDPDRSITLQVHWDGGDACDLGKKLLESVVKNIKAGSSLYRVAQGNLVNLDPCASLSDSEATSVLAGSAKPDDEADPHDCNWSAESGGETVRVHYLLGPDPSSVATESPKPVKVNSVDGISEKDSSGDGCTVSWKHKPVTGDNPDVDPSWFEVVEVAVDGKPGGKDSCEAALTAAKLVQSKLPAP
ncbi:hypothetical protein [Labedaea rhizosphaerae]|uniref:DUF3558 domain-containing protein n=1 Tax=Labedaea rhizosphaerae TaxID=598644 RepID=A0A4R6SEW9_LABRH|nr:hypothetical protein [Labedaea rhizosphaerae]TDP97626.1 hypothetical protein EV186_103590 [Labedaea rhizosphaerae]